MLPKRASLMAMVAVDVKVTVKITLIRKISFCFLLPSDCGKQTRVISHIKKFNFKSFFSRNKKKKKMRSILFRSYDIH